MAFNYGEEQYGNLINEFQKRNQKQVGQADAQAQMEAQRRGLVGQTGTSDIEMSLRGARTAPIVEAGQGQVAQLMQQMADQRLQDQRTQQQQGYQTSERMGTQEYQGGQNALDRSQQSNMAGFTDPNTGKWINTGGSATGFGSYGAGLQGQQNDLAMANLQRGWQEEDRRNADKKKKKGMWGDIGAGVVGGLAGGAGAGLGYKMMS